MLWACAHVDQCLWDKVSFAMQCGSSCSSKFCHLHVYVCSYAFVCAILHTIFPQRGRPPPVRPKEHLILERRKQEELREEANAVVSYNKQFDLKVSNIYTRTWDAAKVLMHTDINTLTCTLLIEHIRLTDYREVDIPVFFQLFPSALSIVVFTTFFLALVSLLMPLPFSLVPMIFIWVLKQSQPWLDLPISYVHS